MKKSKEVLDLINWLENESNKEIKLLLEEDIINVSSMLKSKTFKDVNGNYIVFKVDYKVYLTVGAIWVRVGLLGYSEGKAIDLWYEFIKDYHSYKQDSFETYYIDYPIETKWGFVINFDLNVNDILESIKEKIIEFETIFEKKILNY